LVPPPGRDGIDNDNNGFVDDCMGYNFADNVGGSQLEGDGSHGTHCAGIIGANSDNGVGVAGTAGGSQTSGSGVSLMTLTCFGKQNTGGFAEAIVYGKTNAEPQAPALVWLSAPFFTSTPVTTCALSIALRC
jgi:subtilisin family serine protease